MLSQQNAKFIGLRSQLFFKIQAFSTWGFVLIKVECQSNSLLRCAVAREQGHGKAPRGFAFKELITALSGGKFLLFTEILTTYQILARSTLFSQTKGDVAVK